MKFKKIISALLALGMMSSMTTAMVHADAAIPELKTEIVKFENDADNEVYKKIGASTAAAMVKQLGDKGAAYLVKYSLTGIALENAAFGEGDKLMSVNAMYDTTNSSNLKMSLAQKYAESPSITPNKDLALGLYGVKKTAEGWYPPEETAIGAEETTNVLLGTLILLTDDTIPVTFTPSSKEISEVITGHFSFGSYAGDDSKQYYRYSTDSSQSKLKMSAFTLGTPASTVKLSKVEITSTATEVVDGQTLALTAKAVNDDNSENKTATLAWTSSKEDVATVEGGVVTAKKPGTTTISVTATDGTDTATANIDITVTKATPFVKSIGITGETTVEEGQTLTLTAVTKDQYDDPITVDVEWKSSDEDVATVVDGVVTAKTAGKTTITANVKGQASFKSEKEITVTAKPVVNPVITINGATGFVDGTAVTAGEEKGFVWTPVIISNYKAGTYTATFKADGETRDKTNSLKGMPAVEGNPTVTFAVILRTNKTGVKLGIDFAE